MDRHFISLFRARGPQVVTTVSLANICFEHTLALADDTNAAPHSFRKLARPLQQNSPANPEMNLASKRILKITAPIIMALPLLSASAGRVLGPTVLHPFRRRLTVRQIAQADQVFTGLGATCEDLIVRANDRIPSMAGRLGPPIQTAIGFFSCTVDRAIARSCFLVAAYSVVMMDARAHGNSAAAS
jgi:hypothetical protein